MNNKSSLWNTGHWPTLVTTFFYFDFSFMVWTVLGPLSVHIKDALHLNDQQTGLMVAVPSLGGAGLRLALGFLVDRIGAKNTGLLAQCMVMGALAWGWLVGLGSYQAVILMGFMLGFGGASFAVALPQASRWYPPHLQGTVLGLAGAGNIGVVIDALLAPRVANAYGWAAVFGFALIPAVLVFIVYAVFSKEAPLKVKPKQLGDYLELSRDQDTHCFCFFYAITFGGFAGLAASLVLYFKSTYGLPKVEAGDWAALCTFVGVMARPLGGVLADRIGGIRTLTFCYLIAGTALAAVGFATTLGVAVVLFVIALGALGAGNGSVFQLLPQRFGKELGLMTGLVGAGGGLVRFYWPLRLAGRRVLPDHMPPG
jgi:NNP family nitrate/nitrite transporter-like MFS transporter